MESIKAIGDAFSIEGRFISGEEISSGLINATYRATYEEADGLQRRYILQRINELVFKDPCAVMRNIEKVTQHIGSKSLLAQKICLYPARDGKSCVKMPEGGFWRCYNYIENCHTYDVVENTKLAYQAAYAFGAFQDLVSDLAASELEETLPNFHNTPLRLKALEDAIEADSNDRVRTVKAEIAFILDRIDWVSVVVDGLSDGSIPLRVTHNDTKINNVMIDIETDQAVCVIDLDTVMPGSSLYDFGDLVRTATSPVSEDEVDLNQVHMRMPMFEALVSGFLDAVGNSLNQREIELLAFSGKLITLETCMRFLTDYLEGDNYFKVSREDHNLDRCRTQLKLVESIESQEKQMVAYVRSIAGTIGD